MDTRLHELVEAADLNGLLRAVDGLCATKSWDELLELADRCEDALERGKQLWPITAHIDYRIALEAPASYAGPVLGTDLGRFAPGPLTEVAASTHRWDELAPHIETAQTAAYVAQERVLRGETLDGDDRCHPEVLELPLHLEPWEPDYVLARYAADHVEVTDPWTPSPPTREAEAAPGPELDEPELVECLLELVHPWISESNGAARAEAVEGSALEAIAALTVGPFRIDPLTPGDALRRMAWAGSSGGAHGRRRGAAYGRSSAWFAAAVLGELEWPVEPPDVERAITRLKWFRWDEGEPEKGWALRLAVEHPSNGWAVAIGATDLLEDDEQDS